ncbi:hypothetical protein [Streptomyces sp. NPDC093591]|uniref:hypothetical protein n=1 Tax=Streptomyces sp. NPDC093591 TaxID=3366044 RepID=UPI003818DEAA
MWSEHGTGSNNLPGRPAPDDLGGHLRIHEGAELIRHGLIRHGARLVGSPVCPGRPGAHLYGTRPRGLPLDTAR